MCFVLFELKIQLFFNGKNAHVVLENNIGRYCVTLCLKEMTCPKDITQFIIHCDKFGFCRTFSVEFLFVWRTGDSSCAKSGDSTSLAATVIMNLVWSIHVQANDWKRFSRKCEFELTCPIEVFEDASRCAPVILIQYFTLVVRNATAVWISWQTCERKSSWAVAWW